MFPVAPTWPRAPSPSPSRSQAPSRCRRAAPDVRGLEIAVKDPLLVGGFERVRDLLRDRERLVDRNRSARDALRQVVALDEFHHERRDARALLQALDRGDVRMVQRGERLRFAREARQAVRVVRERFGQDLDRDGAIQLRIAGAVHLAHAAFADRRIDFVDAEARAGQGQSLWIIWARLDGERESSRLTPKYRVVTILWGVVANAASARGPRPSSDPTDDRDRWSSEPMAK